MRSARKVLAVLGAGIAGLVLAVVAPAFACAPGPTLRADPAEAPAGSMVQLRVDGFIGSIGSHTVSPVEVRWHDSEGDLTGKLLTETAGPSFTITVQVPPSAQGLGYFSAIQWNLSDNTILVRKAIPFLVTSGGPPVTPGYRLVASDGGVFAFGASQFHGSMGGRPLDKPIVGMASTRSGNGYWLVASDGGIFAFGDAGFHGSTGGLRLSGPVVGMARTASGRGYWLVGSDGGIFAFGDAAFLGSPADRALPSPIVGMTSLAENEYLLAAANGGVYVYSSGGVLLRDTDGPAPSATVPPPADPAFPPADPAAFATGLPLTSPVVGIVASPERPGNWLVAGDGGVFALGGAPFYGSPAGRLAAPVVGMARSTQGQGYWLAGGDGGIFSYGDAPFLGSMGGVPLVRPIVGVSSV